MKNKHLVLLFLAVLAAGAISRRLPWHWDKDIHTNLLHLDSSLVTQVSMQAPGQAPLLLDRTESGWAITEGGRGLKISEAQAAQWLAALQGLHSLKVIKGKSREALGLSAEHGIQVIVRKGSEVVEECWLGDDTWENGQPAMYVLMPKHEGLYLVAGHWRDLFSHVFEDFRENQLLVFDRKAVQSVVLVRRDGSVHQLDKNPETARWETVFSMVDPSAPAGEFSTTDDSVQTWLRGFERLQGFPFADYFDESRSLETLQARFSLFTETVDTLRLDVFYLSPPDLPEDPAALPPPHAFSPFVLHSSQNPQNYFALTDTALAARLLHGLFPAKN